MINVEQLFWDLYRAPVEKDVEEVLKRYSLHDNSGNWRPYGGTESNFSIVENQQASPIPALIEKITNGIDAILMRRCLEEGIDPKSPQAPRSIQDAVNRFFLDHKNWDLSSNRRSQAKRLQILADGPRNETSLIIYDDGEGQLPEDFTETFLSLLQGNKNEIHFVQGKYNMGGTGAIAFCGKARYQLIGSKRFDNDKASFGFTLIRRHPLTAEEQLRKKMTWYEYLVADNGLLPSFPTKEMDLGLYRRAFTTGTILKLYSYGLPAGAKSVISRDLNQSINEYLFDPALPIFTIDSHKRYPHDRNPERPLYGLKRRLEEDDSKYVEEFFSDQVNDNEFGNYKLTCYVFKTRIDDKSAKETRQSIRREFFKNNMSVLFSINGQVHGRYTSEFITRSLKLPLLKDHLLIHVDCTNIRTEVRNELFMASRDRLKEGDESARLRRKLVEKLSKGRLSEIHSKRKASISVESTDAEDLLRSVTRNLPINEELAKLFSQTLPTNDGRGGHKKDKAADARKKRDNSRTPPFNPQRFPSYFKINAKSPRNDGVPLVKIPKGEERNIRFSTDVEDQYFDRVNAPGELRVGVLGPSSNEEGGGNRPGTPKKVETILDVTASSPNKGTIRVLVKPTKDLKVGDAIRVKASLSNPGGDLEEIFYVKITDPERQQSPPKKGGDEPNHPLALPKLQLVYKDAKDGRSTWDALEDAGIDMSRDVVVYPLVEGEKLHVIYINMDSHVLLSHRSKLKSHVAIDVADKRYISAVYFHALFLYTITKHKEYEIVKQQNGKGDEASGDISTYLQDLFQNSYAQFLLNFDTQELIAAIEE